MNQITSAYNFFNSPSYEKIDLTLSQTEKYLNYFGYVPVISILTGTAREYLGFVEVIVGLSLGIFRNMQATIASSTESKEKLYRQADVELSYAMHGLGNIVRGNIEKLSIASIWPIVINKLALLFYDLFELRMNYTNESFQTKYGFMREIENPIHS